jgi:hypothetical protein
MARKRRVDAIRSVMESRATPKGICHIGARIQA